jgi:hypothetical protein
LEEKETVQMGPEKVPAVPNRSPATTLEPLREQATEYQVPVTGKDPQVTPAFVDAKILSP